MDVLVKKSFPYGGTRRAKGDIVSMPKKFARVFVATGKAAFVPDTNMDIAPEPEPAKLLETENPEEVVSPEPWPDPPEEEKREEKPKKPKTTRKRTYKRRDMTAED